MPNFTQTLCTISMVTLQKYKTASFLYFSWHFAYLLWGICFTMLPLLTEGPIFVSVVGIIPLAIFFWMIFKLHKAEANEDGLILKNLTSKVELDWSEIQSCEETSKFPIARVIHYKIKTKSGKSYRFPLDRQVKHVIGISLEDSTPMERFISRMIGRSKIEHAKTRVENGA